MGGFAWAGAQARPPKVYEDVVPKVAVVKLDDVTCGHLPPGPGPPGSEGPGRTRRARGPNRGKRQEVRPGGKTQPKSAPRYPKEAT